jgi:hypothetical protein
MSGKPPVEPGPDDFRRIAESIGRLADTGKALQASGLSRRATLVLLHDATNVPMRDIKLILDALQTLRTHYLTKVI